MRFLVDNAISPSVASGLRELGHNTAHVRELGMAAADDEQILDRAALEDRVLISADTDFGTLLALRSEAKPSVILIRGDASRYPRKQLSILTEILPTVEADLLRGCIVTVTNTRLRIRHLPIGGSPDL